MLISVQQMYKFVHWGIFFMKSTYLYAIETIQASIVDTIIYFFSMKQRNTILKA